MCGTLPKVEIDVKNLAFIFFTCITFILKEFQEEEADLGVHVCHTIFLFLINLLVWVCDRIGGKQAWNLGEFIIL